MSVADIARALGLHRAGRQFSGRCPSCDYPSGFAVTERDGMVLYHCHSGGCSQSDVREALQRAGLVPQKGDRSPVKQKLPSTSRKSQPRSSEQSTRQDKPAATTGAPPKAQAAFAIWRRSRPAEGTAVEMYLRVARGYGGPIPPALRFAAGKHPSDPDHYHPMMVAAVVRDDRLIAIHRTFLRADGTGKADLDPAKMTLGASKGAAVPLAAAGPMLAVAEGIETALSFMQATGVPTWSALSAGGIRSLILPTSVREVIIAADNDPTGLAKAHAAARRWMTYGRTVRVVVPPTGRGDFNDMARAVS